jgi:hypothetical protein
LKGYYGAYRTPNVSTFSLFLSILLFVEKRGKGREERKREKGETYFDLYI